MSNIIFHIPQIETDRLILRAPHPDDVSPIAAFFDSSRSHYVGGPKPKGGAWQFLTFMVGHWHMRGFGMWVVTTKDSDLGLGLVGFYHPVGWPECELGWHIWNVESEGKGIAYEAACAARDHAAQNWGWSTLVSYISPKNTRSIVLAERLGAVLDTTAELPVTSETEPAACYRHPMPESGNAPSSASRRHQ